MATIKEIIDQEKPVFDYLNYALRLAAWAIGLALSFQINRTNTDPFFHAVNLVAIASCAALGLYALLRFGIMNVRIAETFASRFATTRIERAVAAIAAVWPVLAVTFVGMLICSTLGAAVGGVGGH
jgi:hypothetical protein